MDQHEGEHHSQVFSRAKSFFFFNLALSRPLFGDLRIRKDLSGLFKTANDILDFLTTLSVSQPTRGFDPSTPR